MALDALVRAVLVTGAGVGVALGEHHPVETVVAAAMLFMLFRGFASLLAGTRYLAAARMRLVVLVYRTAIHEHI